MPDTTRRSLFKALAAGALATPLAVAAAPAKNQARALPAPDAAADAAAPRWGRGIEGQRKADRGDGSFLNPIIGGDHPDPSVLKDGDDYYLTY